jgi:hypothetical protein
VLKEMRDPGDARAFVHGTDPRHPACGYVGRAFSGQQQDTHSVVEGIFFNRYLLSRCQCGKKRYKKESE